MTPFAIAGIQMYVDALKSNVDAMVSQVDILMARFPWTQMVLFSELAAFGPLHKFAQPVPNDTEARFQALAKKHRVWLVPGSLFEQAEDGKIYNTAPVITPEGEVIRRYRKMFPFRPYEAQVEAGSDFCVFDVPDVGRFGLTICYDIWFPETTRQLTSQGVEVLLHPVLTGTTDRQAELSIARATAAQFQCYVIDVNGLGAGGNGQSCVIDPSANVLHQSGGQSDMFPIEIDLDQVRRQREHGMRGLGQVLKSFRDRPGDFSVYDRNSGTDAYLRSLGPLEIPQQGSRAGLSGITDLHPGMAAEAVPVALGAAPAEYAAVGSGVDHPIDHASTYADVPEQPVATYAATDATREEIAPLSEPVGELPAGELPERIPGQIHGQMPEPLTSSVLTPLPGTAPEPSAEAGIDGATCSSDAAQRKSG